MSSKKPRTNSIEAVSPNPYIEKYEEIKKKYRCEVFDAVRSVTNSTLKTKWVTREIDKITSMIYFIIVVSVFIWATLFVQGFLDKFVVTFQGGNQTSVGDAMSSACSPVGSFTKGSWGSDPTK